MYALPPQDRQDELPDQDSCCNGPGVSSTHLPALVEAKDIEELPMKERKSSFDSFFINNDYYLFGISTMVRYSIFIGH
jgi:hypothetical protein